MTSPITTPISRALVRFARGGCTPPMDACATVMTEVDTAMNRASVLASAADAVSLMTLHGHPCSKDLMLEAIAVWRGHRSWDALCASLPKMPIASAKVHDQDEETPSLSPGPDAAHAGLLPWDGDENDVVYTDSRGEDMTPVSFSEALSNILFLARSVMRKDVVQDRVSVDTVTHLLGYGNLDTELAFPQAAGDWKDIGKPSRTSDMNQPAQAIRYCLWLAEKAATNPMSVKGIDEADECDHEQMCFDLVRDLVGMHGGNLATCLDTWKAAPSSATHP